MYKVYAVYYKRHKKIYIGQTRNMEIRTQLHNSHTFTDNYTSRFDGDWVIVYEESVSSREEALRREKQLKSYRGRQFVKKFIPT